MDMNDPISTQYQHKSETFTSCPYLGTVKREMLDFDFEKTCSVTLSTTNIYSCLVCGKYYQGRNQSSPAFLHSLNDNHHVFLNLNTKKFYCLPENYEIIDPNLDDILLVLYPTYTKEQVEMIDKNCQELFSVDLNRRPFRPGFIGLNKIKSTDYVNVIIQALVHISPVRNYMLCYHRSGISLLLDSFSDLTKRIWNKHAYKNHTSPQEFLKHVIADSNGRYDPAKSIDPHEFFTWILNTFSKLLGSLITVTFQGKIKIQGKIIPFFHLNLDLPPLPLFTNELEQNIMPQISMEALMDKYSGKNQDYDLVQLPKYLIIYIKRFKKQGYGSERNSTIVNFPLQFDLRGCSYRLVVNIVIDQDNNFKVILLDNAMQTWYEIQDLFVKQTMPQAFFMSETYIQIWEKL